MLKLAGLLFLVVLILVGALMPLKYTERLRLPGKGAPPPGGPGGDRRENHERAD